jgi:hypothetical protein
MYDRMASDPILDEIRRYREEYAARFNYDLDAMCRDLRERENSEGRRTVTLSPKRVPKGASDSPPTPA